MSIPSNAVVEAALALARAGYPVFPVDPESKKPLTEHGFKDATRDEDVIMREFARRPVGVAVETAGLVVVDVDDPQSPLLREPGVKEALETAPTSRTPGGGTHHFFRRPEGFRGKNWNGIVAHGIDLKTDGGYVVLPPTERAEGAYVWVRGDLRETTRDSLPMLPDAINRHIDLAADRASAKERSSVVRSTAGGQIHEGQRNSTLTSHAGLLRRRGWSQADIARELHVVNATQCKPPLETGEVDQIASSIARYPAGQSSGWHPPPPALTVRRMTFDEVMATTDDGREALIEGVMRRGDIVNLIGVPKSRKSMLVTQIAMQMATGSPCLGEFKTRPGRTLIIDAEVGAASLRDRFRLLSAELGIELAKLSPALEVCDLRGKWDQAEGCRVALSMFEPGEFDLVIVDPLYRMLPDGADENDNIEMASFYRMLSHHVTRCGVGCFVVHHAPKSNGTNRSTTDAGAGAGAISRAADGQLVLTQRDGGWFLRGVFRGFPDFEDRELERGELAWRVEGVSRPKPSSKPPKAKKAKSPTKEEFAAEFVTSQPETADAIIARAVAKGISKREAKALLDAGVRENLVKKDSKGGRTKDLFNLSKEPKAC